MYDFKEDNKEWTKAIKVLIIVFTTIATLLILGAIAINAEANSAPKRDIKDITDTTRPHMVDEYVADTCFDLQDEYDRYELMAEAIGMVESGLNDDAYNAKEDAAGYLQIRPCMLAEANRIIGEDIYVPSDRYDRAAALGIFVTVMKARNVQNIDSAINVWNKGAGDTYRRKVHAFYDLMKGSEA